MAFWGNSDGVEHPRCIISHAAPHRKDFGEDITGPRGALKRSKLKAISHDFWRPRDRAPNVVRFLEGTWDGISRTSTSRINAYCCGFGRAAIKGAAIGNNYIAAVLNRNNIWTYCCGFKPQQYLNILLRFLGKTVAICPSQVKKYSFFWILLFNLKD